MMHIIPFELAVESVKDTKTYDVEKWIYLPGIDLDYRYVLGTAGDNPVISIGINPSTAKPNKPDNTIKAVSRIAARNGFDSYLMFNVYPQRATDPNELHVSLDEKLHNENMNAFQWLLEQCKMTPTIWAAWGTLIEKRPYLRNCLKEMIMIGKEYGPIWYHAGKLTQKGHPHHPLYLRSDEKLCVFDIEDYLRNL